MVHQRKHKRFMKHPRFKERGESYFAGRIKELSEKIKELKEKGGIKVTEVELDEMYDEIWDKVENENMYKSSAIMEVLEENGIPDEEKTELYEYFDKEIKIIHSDDIEEGALIDFGDYGNLYVVRKDVGIVSENMLWVTDEEEDRYNQDARGWFIKENLAKRILEEPPDEEEYKKSDEEYAEDNEE